MDIISRNAIYGIGVDIVGVKRLERIVRKWGDRFLDRVFTEAEKDYCLKKARPFNSLAARFAAKEAFIKALSAEEVIPLKEIETVNDKKGAPFIKLYGRAEDLFQQKVGSGVIYISLSHDGDFAVAFVIIEKTETGGII